MRTTWDRVLTWRVARHHLDRPTGAGPVEVARRLGGVQAQVFSSAQLAISVRSADVRPDDVARAVWEERTLVKTWTVRGTLHLVPADELPLWVAALDVHDRFRRGSWLRAHGIELEDLEAVVATIPEAVSGRALTRSALAAEVARLTGRPHLAAALDGSWGALLKPAALLGLVCFGPSEGRNVTFVSAPEWIGGWREVPREEATAVVVRRYLDAYGPATVDDLARWFGIEVAPVRRRFAAVADDLVQVDVDGESAWITPEGAEQVAATRARRTPTVRLLPGFDPYVVGSLRRLDELLPGPHRALVSRTSGWISAVLLVDGRIAGTWTSEVRRGRMEVAVSLLRPLTARETKAATADAARLGGLLGTEVDVSFGGPAGPSAAAPPATAPRRRSPARGAAAGGA